MGRLCKKSSNTLYYVSWCLTSVRFYLQLSWPQVCTGRDLSQRAAYWNKADLLEGWIKCITVHFNTDNSLCGMSKCILYLTLFLSSISFHWVTATSKQNKANFLLHTKHLFQTQTYSGQTHRKMHTVICLEKSSGLSESVNI